MFYDWTWGAFYSVQALESEVSRAQRGASDAKQRARELELRFDRALLACEALWTFVRDKLGVTEQEMIDRINQLDLSDGKFDGKIRKSPVTCPKCRRNLAPRFERCLYCGEPLKKQPFA